MKTFRSLLRPSIILALRAVMVNGCTTMGKEDKPNVGSIILTNEEVYDIYTSTYHMVDKLHIIDKNLPEPGDDDDLNK